MANNDWYYEPPSDRAWDFFIDQWDGEDEPTDGDFEDWMQDQEDARDDALIAQAEAAKEMEWEDRDYGDEY